MSLEQKANTLLNRFPALKRAVKRSYQLAMYTLSPKVKAQGAIRRVSPDDEKEYFFGYYDKSPWDASGRYMLCLRADETYKQVCSDKPAEILCLDTESGRFELLGKTRTWNVQQGCMLQWLGPGFDRKILYNDFQNGSYCSVIVCPKERSERVLPAAVYCVAADGESALTLDFSRLHRLRPGYGYRNLPDSTENEPLPDSPAIWAVDLLSGEVRPLLKYTDFAAFCPRPEMQGKDVVHKVNHLMFSPSGKRFMVLHRWFSGKRKYSRLITANREGGDLCLLLDDDMVSHCCWKNDEEILAFANKRGMGQGYYLLRDKTSAFRRLWPKISADGHPSYSPDKKFVLTDTYPDRTRMAEVRILREDDEDGMRVAARVFAPFRYDNDLRCDLHPRWSRDGKRIAFDAAFEGRRGLYVAEVESDA